MKRNLQDWPALAAGDLPGANAVLLSEWEVPGREVQLEAAEKTVSLFDRFCSGQRCANLLSYSCFLDTGGRHLIHFSQWKDVDARAYFEKNVPQEKISEHAGVKALGKQIYFPYRTHTEDPSIEKTALVVFVKQYFKPPGQAGKWVDLVLETMEKEGKQQGLLQQTFYLNAEQDQLLNYAFWEKVADDDQLLLQYNPETKNHREAIASFDGWLKTKAKARKCREFIRVR